MSLGEYTPKVGESFVFTPNPDDAEGLDVNTLSLAGEVFTIVGVDYTSKFPFTVLVKGEKICLDSTELSFILVTTTIEDWL
jgi:hypothetical protein